LARDEDALTSERKGKFKGYTLFQGAMGLQKFFITIQAI
jgi:hypothetical protein